MSSAVLKSLSSRLFMCLQGIYWGRDDWKMLKPDFEQLAKSLVPPKELQESND